MRVTEQIDAMEASAVDPYKYLVATHILACIVAMPLLTVATDFVGVFMGWGGLHAGGTDAPEAVPFKRLQRRHFRRHSSADAKDRDLRTDHRFRRLFQGMRTSGGTAGVGRSATSSVVLASLFIMLADIVLVRLIIEVF